MAEDPIVLALENEFYKNAYQYEQYYNNPEVIYVRMRDLSPIWDYKHGTILNNTGLGRVRIVGISYMTNIISVTRMTENPPMPDIWEI